MFNVSLSMEIYSRKSSYIMQHVRRLNYEFKFNGLKLECVVEDVA